MEGEIGGGKVHCSLSQPHRKSEAGILTPSGLPPVHAEEQGFLTPSLAFNVGCLHEAMLTLGKNANSQRETSADLAAIKKINPWSYRC